MSKFNSSELRKAVLEMAYAGSTVHIACAFSIVVTAGLLLAARSPVSAAPIDGASQPQTQRTLTPAGETEVNYFSDGSRLKGLSDVHVPGCEVTSGSLGHGLSVGVGMALAAKLNGTDQYCYVIVGDGEMNEGPMWEAMLFASHRALDNLIVIVDENGFQAMGRTSEVLRLGSLQDKFQAFDFDVITVDGHDEAALEDGLAVLKKNKNGKPKAIIAHTIKGKGVSFMEDDNAWHYTRLSEDTFKQAMSELGSQ